MNLQKQTVIDVRTILEDGQIQVREATYVVDIDTGERVMGPTYHRYVVVPGDDVSKLDQGVQRLAATEWTDEVIAAFRRKASEASRLPPK